MEKTNEQLINAIEEIVARYDIDADKQDAPIMRQVIDRLRQQSEDSASVDWMERFPVFVLAETNLESETERDALVHLNETMTLREALADIRRGIAEKVIKS